MNQRKLSGMRHALGVAALIAAFVAGCGGGGEATVAGAPVGQAPPVAPTSSTSLAMVPDAAPQTFTEMAKIAPFAPPVPLPEVGAQFENSPTGTAYPKLATLYPGHDGPVVDDGMVLPWLSKRAPIRFTVFVQTTLDTDGDGKPDRLALRVVQPAEVAEGLVTPVIVRPTPYAGDGIYETRTRGPFLGEAQYLRMGFTVVYTDSLGTNMSEGCPSIMDAAEREANATVVRWLARNRSVRAFNDRGVAMGPPYWSTRHVAMEGVSYGGTMPTMAAVTGVTGLEAIVPVDGISNAYDYFQRYNGVATWGRDELWVVPLDGYAEDNTPEARRPLCSGLLAKLTLGVDSVTNAYNAFWKERNTVALADHIKAATLIAQGQADNNVKTKNAVQLYDALYRLKKPVQLWFHTRDHDDPSWQKEWQKQILLWYSRYLFGVNNGVENQPTYVRETPKGDDTPGMTSLPSQGDSTDTLVGHCHITGKEHSLRDCIPTGELLVKEQAWPATGNVIYMPRSSRVGDVPTLTTDAIGGHAPAPIEFAADASSAKFESPALRNATRFAGTIRLTMPVKFAVAPSNLKAYVYVDGQAVTAGWANPHFYGGLEHAQDIATGTSYWVTVEMMPRDFTVPPGSKLAISVQGYGPDFAVAGQSIGIDLARTTLHMPLVPKAHVEAATQLD